VSKRTYHPDRGDLIEVNFQPSAGAEIDKRRPAVVLSPEAYNRKTGLCIAVPTTSDLTPGPFWIRMPDGVLPKPSLILCDYMKSFDYRERGVASLGKKLDRETMDAIVNAIMDLIDPVYEPKSRVN
jgi:mRNA interferase MazF